MTEILVESLGAEDGIVQPNLHSNGPIQLQGFAADEPRGERSLTSSSRVESERERRERANSRASVRDSVRSEPDLDTIMPLPGASFYKRGYQHVPGEGSDTDSEGSGVEGGGINSPYGTAIASFTTVEVSVQLAGLASYSSCL